LILVQYKLSQTEVKYLDLILPFLVILVSLIITGCSIYYNISQNKYILYLNDGTSYKYDNEDEFNVKTDELVDENVAFSSKFTFYEKDSYLLIGFRFLLINFISGLLLFTGYQTKKKIKTDKMKILNL
jgi:hypothetical protein